MELSSTTSAEIRDQFMTLLLAQLRNQDPLSPVQQQDFMGQLAQFSTLESVEELNSEFTKLLDLQTRVAEQEGFLQATNMLGDTVSYSVPAAGSAGAGGQTVTRVGIVERVGMTGGNVWLEVNGETIGLDQVRGVQHDSLSPVSALAVNSAPPPTQAALHVPGVALAAQFAEEDASTGILPADTEHVLESVKNILIKSK